MGMEMAPRTAGGLGATYWVTSPQPVETSKLQAFHRLRALQDMPRHSRRPPVAASCAGSRLLEKVTDLHHVQAGTVDGSTVSSKPDPWSRAGLLLSHGCREQGAALSPSSGRESG